MIRLVHRSLLACLFLVPAPLWADGGHTVMPVTPWMILPFVALLMSIAVAHFISQHWLEKNYPF